MFHDLSHVSPDDAVFDLTVWLEEMILGRDLTPQEEEQLTTKVSFWWGMAMMRRDQIAGWISRN